MVITEVKLKKLLGFSEGIVLILPSGFIWLWGVSSVFLTCERGESVPEKELEVECWCSKEKWQGERPRDQYRDSSLLVYFSNK